MGGKIAALNAELAAATDEAARNRLSRDLRYWEAQQASAQVMPQAEGDEAGFGSRVTLSRGGRASTIELVGESETDPAQGRINWQAPIARAVLGARPGDVVMLGEDEIEILSVDNGGQA
jgi:transcription elongation GreA/GreB family factor